MIKERIKEILVRRQRAKYFDELSKKQFNYSLYIDRFEKNKVVADKKNVKVCFYDELSKEEIINNEGLGQVTFNLDALNDDNIIVFCSNNGQIFKNALGYFKKYFNEHENIRLCYADEDEKDEEQKADNPYLKPSWSPDSYRNAFYIGSIFGAKVSLVKEALSLNMSDIKYASGRDVIFDTSNMCAADILFLKMAFIEKGFCKREGMEFPIGHIDEVLFHRKPDSDLFMGRKFSDKLYSLDEKTSVSIVIPSKDHPDILRQCLMSIASHKIDDMIDLDIVVVDNGSDAENKEKSEKLIDEIKNKGIAIKYIYEKMEFNFSKMCNLGASKSTGEYILFLNDDIEIVSDEYLTQLTYHAMLESSGAVGCKLLYPGKEKIQHAGITGIHLGPMHKMQGLDDQKEYYFGMNRGIHDFAGVTAAALMVSRKKFLEAGMFYEGLAVAFNDVDLNYNLLENGFYNVCLNFFFLVHHESLSRGDDNKNAAKTERLMNENDILLERHKNMYDADPFYHKMLEGDNVVPTFELQNIVEKEKNEIKVSIPKIKKNGINENKKDECVWVRIDFNDTLKRWNRLYYVGTRKNKAIGKNDSGYFIKGYSFVIGTDNAFFERKLMLRKVNDKDDLTPIERKVYLYEVSNHPRDDIRKNLKDQVNVDLTGFKVRISGKELEDGYYQIGMIYNDKTSRMSIMNWGSKCLKIKKRIIESDF